MNIDTAKITNSRLNSNVAKASASIGSVAHGKAPTVVHDVKSSAFAYGGAIYLSSEYFSITECELENNIASAFASGGNGADSTLSEAYGGAIYIESGSGEISNSVFKGNVADKGGAIYAAADANITLSNSQFITESDTFYVAGGTLTLAGGNSFAATVTNDGGSVTNSGEFGFYVAAMSAGNTAAVVDYSTVEWNADTSFSLTLDTAAQTQGDYLLAANVDTTAMQAETFSVKASDGTVLGTVAVGGSFSYTGAVDHSATYSLAFSGNDLSLEVKNAESIAFLNGAYDGAADSLFASTKYNVTSIYKDGEVWTSNRFDAGWGLSGTGDFNADGKTDFLRSRTDGVVAADFSDGNGGFSVAILNQLGDGWKIEGIGNFNADGKDDVLLAIRPPLPIRWD